MPRLLRLRPIREKLINPAEKYVVFHTNRFISDEEIPSIIESLNGLKNQGYRIVLLPLAYTHGDDVILQKINERAGNQYKVFDRILTAYEMLSVLAGCTLYIGISFHGSVTALSYGKKAIAYNFLNQKKTEDLFRSLNISQYHINKASDLRSCINAIMSDGSQVNLEETYKKIDDHFDRIFNLLCMDTTEDKHLDDFMKQLLKGIESTEREEYVTSLEKSLEWYKNNVHELQGAINWHHEYDSGLIDNIKQKDVRIEELQGMQEQDKNEIYELEQQIFSMGNSFIRKTAKFIKRITR